MFVAKIAKSKQTKKRIDIIYIVNTLYNTYIYITITFHLYHLYTPCLKNILILLV